MGQYWKAVNLDKKQFIDPHKLASGLKLWEQLANPGVGQALVILLAAMPEQRGGGDFGEDPIVGSWAGDRIAIVGDYAEDGDLPAEFEASLIYTRCVSPEYAAKFPGDYASVPEAERYKDVSDAVCAVIERELSGKFIGDGWRKFVSEETT